MTNPLVKVEGISCHEEVASKSALVCRGCKYGSEVDKAIEVYADTHNDWATPQSIGEAVTAMGCENPEIESVESECGRSYIKTCPNLVVKMLIENLQTAEQSSVQSNLNLVE